MRTMEERDEMSPIMILKKINLLWLKGESEKRKWGGVQVEWEG